MTGPVLGIVVGGYVSSCIGGIHSKTMLFVAICVAVACLASAAPIPFLSFFPVVASLVWFLLFFGGSLLPYMTGVML